MTGSATASVHASAQARLLAELSAELSAWQDAGLLRRLTPIEAIDGARVRIGGRDVVCWCSNDYLGLSAHPRLAQAAGQAVAHSGVGARASRLLAGTTTWHVQLEAALAAWYGTEAALVFPSGYLANLGTFRALFGADDTIFVDRLAHASLIDAARATGATFRLFRHNDPGHAGELLARGGRARRRVIVTEGVFSMDGDRAPLAELSAVAEAHGALVYVDDAHGAFVAGPSGRGAPEAAGVAVDRLLYLGTLGKALGCQGGFVAGPAPLIDLLVNRARTFMYATALAVPVAAAATEALRLLREDPEPIRRLQGRSRSLHARLLALASAGAGWTLPAASRREPSHIMPLVAGETAHAVQLAAALWDRGIWAPAIRPPTVPRWTARVRLSLTAEHTEEQVDALSAALRDAAA